MLNIFSAGLELLSYLGGKPSVISEMWPQRAHSVHQSQDRAGGGADHHCVLSGAMRRQCPRRRSAKGDRGDLSALSELTKALRMGDFQNQRGTHSSTDF